jgi:2-hydroxy-6-oxonona-2,4-dienedioate hydrolase
VNTHRKPRGQATWPDEPPRQPEFRWLERGAGEPVVLLHGLMGQMRHWEPVLEALVEECRPIALTLPIFHPALPEASIDELARYVVRFLDALEIPRVVVGGNSLGGHVALRLTLEHADRVSGVVLTGSSGLFERSFTSGVPHRPDRKYVRHKMEEVFFDPRLVTDGWVDDVHRVLTTAASALRVLRFARDARRDNLEGRLKEIRVPALLVWGLDDRITPPEVAERFRARLPDAQLWQLPRCGHAPMLEWPEAFADIVADWLEGTGARRWRGAPPRRGDAEQWAAAKERRS